MLAQVGRFVDRMKLAKVSGIVLGSLLTLTGCKKSGNAFDFASDGGGQGTTVCEITNVTPTSDSFRVSSVGSTPTVFTVGLTAADCEVTFSLNGVDLTGTDATKTIVSSALQAGSNTIIARAGATTHTWTVSKNAAPTCSSQTPNVNGNSMGPNTPMILTGHGADADGDPMTFSWTVNDTVVNPPELTTFIGATSSQATFVPTSAFLGVNSIKMTIFDGLDTTMCNWNVGVAGSCSIAGTTPVAPGPVRVKYDGATLTNFQVSTDPGCLISWTLNGTPMAATTATNPILSSDLTIGSNFLQVTVTNGTSSETKNWAVVRNSPPICVSQTPGSTGNTLGVGSNVTLSGIASDLNADTLTFTWVDNGAPVDPSIFAITHGVNTSQAVFTPTSTYVGANLVKAIISDSYDTVECQWNVAVVPACSVVSATPSAATVRVANAGATVTSFVAVPNDASCVLSWTLNGNPLAGATAFQLINSSAMIATNTVVATMSNGFSTASRTWTVNKNSPPTCSSQTPAAGTSTVGVGSPIILRATGADTESDPLTYSWRNNGLPTNPAQFTLSTAGGVGQAIFTPNSGYIGVNTVNADINDGFDTQNCQWTVNVISPCAVSSSLPSTGTTKVAFAPSTSNAFGIVPSDAACAVSWTLNGSPVPGSAFLSINSSDFSDAPASNFLVATLDNGYTAPTTRTWSVTKNRVPACSSQTPVANPPNMTYGTTEPYTALASDPDADTLTNFTWRFNGVTNGALFTPINTLGNQSVTTFRPTLTNVGTAHAITCSFDDGYDSGACNWTLDVIDPNTVSITSCTPVGNPVVLHSTGPLATQVLTANATGNGLVYTWRRDGATQGGFTTPNFSISSASLPVGDYAFKATVDDAYGNSDECDWNVKVNALPVVSSTLPDPATTYRLNYNMTMGFSVAATDANVGDTLTYNWTLDGVPNAALPTGGSSTTYTPGGLFSALGAHVVSVSISDGTETVTRTWNIEVNLFSDACNTMLNSSTSGGRVCTLVGVPTIGNGNIPSADQTQMRVRPAYATEDGSGNLIFTDHLNHTVNYFNRSGASISRFGTTIPAGRMLVVMGNGANGQTQDNLYRTAFKLNTPMDVQYDSDNGALYVADYTTHRIARMDSNGLVTTVLGVTNSTTNNAGANTDGNLGTTHVCANPVGMRLVNFGGNKWLYVACSGTHAIKRMNADTNSADYGKTYIVVGRLGGGATGQANYDGPAGASGDAQVNQPWAIADDGVGNIYWTESNGSARVRMVTTGGSGMNFFTLARTPSAAFHVGAMDVAGVLTTATGFATQAVTPQASGASQLSIDGPTSAITSQCIPMSVRVLNASAQLTNLTGATTVQLAVTGAGSGFYSDTGCTAALPSNQLAMSAGENTKLFYFKKTSAGNATSMTATAAGPLTSLPPAGVTVVVGASVAPTTLSVRTAALWDYTTCQRVVVQVQGAGGQASLAGSNRTVRLSHNATGNFYADAACATTPIVQTTILSTDSHTYVYFARTVSAPTANFAISLAGNTNNNTASPGSSYPSANVAANVGVTSFRLPRGLAVWAPGGTVRGFFVNNWDHHRTIFVNMSNTTSYTVGGSTAGPNQSVVVLGTGSGGFNADGVGSTARTWDGYGMNINPGHTKMLYPDYDNYRMREFDLSINNGDIVTLIGAGRSRSGNLGDSPTPATQMYLNGPSQVQVDNTNRKLYISDSSSARIRSVDLLTGYVSTIIGKGSGAANVENEDPTNVFMAQPRAMTMMTQSGVPFLIYNDQNATTANNQNCQIRAYNMSLTTDAPNFFGVSITRNRVATIAGDYVNGCIAWNTAPVGTPGMAATTAKLYNPEGLTNDGTNLYFANYNDHCVMKITSSGQLYPHIGTCGTAGTFENNTSNTLLRFPTAVLIDPAYAADGNMFIADAIDSNPSRIRYVNYRTTAVTIGSSTVPGAPGGGVGIVQTLWTISPSGNSQGRPYGLAAFDSQICYAAGMPGDGGTGAHNVTCYNRNDGLGAASMRLGPNEASGVPTRGGATIDLTQENQPATAGLANSPYGLSFDSGGNLYISERNNHVIRLVRRWW